MYKQAWLGCPGSGKSTLGLSQPGVEQHVFGSNEDETAKNFIGRKDILKPVKLDWYTTLTPEEQAKFTDEKVSEIEIGRLTKFARAKNVARYRRYIYQLKNEFATGKPPMRPNRDGEMTELKSIFLDNGTPFAQDFQDYVETVFAKEFETKEGNFNSIAFSIKYQSEITDFLRVLVELPCNVGVSFHIAMTLDEATAAKADFMKDTQKGIKYPKEWQPLIYGKAKYALSGLFDHVFYLYAEENPGQANKYIAKLEADDSTVGISKSRLQPFDNPRRIEFPKNEAFKFFDEAVKSYMASGKPSPSAAKR